METYLVLLRVGFTLPLLLPAVRCALTTPFHPYLYSRTNHWRSTFCGTFRRLTPPRRYLALYLLEPGLSSTSLPHAHNRTLERSMQRLPSQLVNKSNIDLKKISAQGDSLNSSWPITRAKTKFNAEENDPLAVVEISTMPIYVAYLDHLSDLLLEAE